MSSCKPSEGADQVQTGEKVPRGLLVARGDGPKMLDYIEEPLDIKREGIAATARMIELLAAEGVFIVAVERRHAIGGDGCRCGESDRGEGDKHFTEHVHSPLLI